MNQLFYFVRAWSFGYFLLFFLCQEGHVHQDSNPLESQESLNRRMAFQANEFYEFVRTNQSMRLPVDGEEQTAPKESGWTVEKTLIFHEGLQCLVYAHNLKPNSGLKPSEALKNFYKKYDQPFVLGCEVAWCIPLFSCILEILTPDVFDTHFSRNFKITLDQGKAFLKLLSHKKAPDSWGECGYFMNTIRYIERHPKGNGTGHNVYCIGFNEQNQPLYHGIGLTFKEGPQLKSHLLEILRTDFLAEPTEVEKPFVQESADCRLVRLGIAKNPQSWAAYLNHHQQNSPNVVMVLDHQKLKSIQQKYAQRS